MGRNLRGTKIRRNMCTGDAKACRNNPRWKYAEGRDVENKRQDALLSRGVAAGMWCLSMRDGRGEGRAEDKKESQ